MSNYSITLRHKRTGEECVISALDNYFGSGIYGYLTPYYILTEAQLNVLYYPVKDDEIREINKQLGAKDATDLV